MNEDGCNRLMDKAVWLCFKILSSLFLTVRLLLSISTWEVSFL